MARSLLEYRVRTTFAVDASLMEYKSCCTGAITRLKIDSCKSVQTEFSGFNIAHARAHFAWQNLECVYETIQLSLLAVRTNDKFGTNLVLMLPPSPKIHNKMWSSERSVCIGYLTGKFVFALYFERGYIRTRKLVQICKPRSKNSADTNLPVK